MVHETNSTIVESIPVVNRMGTNCRSVFRVCGGLNTLRGCRRLSRGLLFAKHASTGNHVSAEQNYVPVGNYLMDGLRFR